MKYSFTQLPRGLGRTLHQLFISATATILTLAVMAWLVSPAAAAPPTGYYSVPYSNDVYYHHESSGYVGTYKASYDQWVNAGSPTPRPVATDFVKYPWSPTIYAVSYFDGGWLWSGPLAFEQWQKANFPTPRNAGFIAGTTYHKWATSGELFAVAPDNTTHKLSYAEWAASGFQEPEYRTNAGYQKLSWDSSIGEMYQINTGAGYPIDYAAWASESFPTPQTVSRFPGDDFCQYWWTNDIYYYGPTWSGSITFGQWAAAGYPQPTAC
ncbi:hypothetical protein ACFVYC_01905 [Pseudarthrobacter sp. NPDC058329]|uniref:hypothetical protein n=1 Tax=Pseudarthrobacter sp. NPDC058329 TaxID=3346448 RepID=UPI0036D9848C